MPQSQEFEGELILPMAKDHPGWGYTRIVGALANVGHAVARTTVAKIP